MRKIIKKPFILPVVFLIALGLVIFKVKNKTPIAHQDLALSAKTVEVIRAQYLPYRATEVAYGYIEPAILLKTKAEVSGKVSYLHPDLEQGGSIPKNTIVLRIEPTNALFSLDQNKALLAGNRSSFKQLKIEERSMRRSLKLARADLTVGQKELSRLTKLVRKGVIARSKLDTEDHKVLQLQQKVADLEGKLSSFSSRQSVVNSQINQSKTKLAQSKDTLGRTEIKTTFDARIGQVFIENGEFVSVGSVLFEALGTSAVKINAELPVNQFRVLMAGAITGEIDLESPQKFQQVLKRIQLEAIVRLVSNEQADVVWQGQLLRIGEAINPTRNTVTLTILVKNPYKGVIAGKRPPLLKGMFSEITLMGPVQKRMVLPIQALHQGRVYIVNQQQELEIRTVEVAYKQADLVILKQGLAAGELVIIGDLMPVIQGLPLKPVIESALEKQMAQQALGALL